VQIKALACELPCDSGLPLSRFSSRDIATEAISRGIVAQISGTTVWRWLNEDAIKPWQYRSWIFPRDPYFEEKAGRILDLYHGIWDHNPLKSNEFVMSADEKTSIQVRDRKHDTLHPMAGNPMKIEHEYRRGGSLNYIAAMDINNAKIFGRCEAKTGIQPFDLLVKDVMSQEPYCSARRVFWIVDNGSSHRGQSSIDRIETKWPNVLLVHLPIHASWLNQIEIYFSIVQRKVLTPNDFSSAEELEEAIINFQDQYEKIAKPFEWKYTKNDLSELMKKLDGHAAPLALSA
jgi:hypothetical protein